MPSTIEDRIRELEKGFLWMRLEAEAIDDAAELARVMMLLSRQAPVFDETGDCTYGSLPTTMTVIATQLLGGVLTSDTMTITKTADLSAINAAYPALQGWYGPPTAIHYGRTVQVIMFADATDGTPGAPTPYTGYHMRGYQTSGTPGFDGPTAASLHGTCSPLDMRGAEGSGGTFLTNLTFRVLP